MNLRNTLIYCFALGLAPLLCGESSQLKPPAPLLTMPGNSKPLASITAPKIKAPAINQLTTLGAAVIPSVQMKILVLGDDVNDFSYQSITAFLNQMGVPFQAIPLDTLTPDGNGNRLSSVPLTDPSTGQGLYQGLIYTDSTFGVCNPNCISLLSTGDWTTLSDYTAQYHVRVVTYYTYPDPKWGLTPVGSGAGYSASSPLQVRLSTAGASVFSYINSANPVPVAGSGSGSIWVYQAKTTAAAGETTTPLLTVGNNVVGVTHTNSSGQETLSLTMDNFPTLLHSLAFSYGVINWVTKGVFLGQRQIYLNPQDDDLLLGNRLYAPTLPQCPIDPSCPDIVGTSADMQALANWQATKRQDPQVPYLRTTFAVVGIGSTPGFAPIPDTIPPAMTSLASEFGWINHTYTHLVQDCYTLSPLGACVPETLAQSLFDIQMNAAFMAGQSVPYDSTGLVTPQNGGLDNLAFFQAAAQEGITSVITVDNPPSPGTGATSIVPSIVLVTRRITNLFTDVDSPLTGVYGSLPDEYNANYGPNGTQPFFNQNQTYAQIIDNESTLLLLNSLLPYEVYPLSFHTSNSIAYDGVHSIMTDLLDATIQKYEKLINLPLYTLKDMRDMAPLLLNRASYNASGVTGVYTPGVSVVLKTNKAGVIPVTGACSLSACPTYGGQMQDSVPMAANSTVTLSLSAAVGVGLSNVTANPAAVNNLSPSQGLVVLNGVASSNIVVSLTSDSAAAAVPPTVTILPGSLSAGFTIATHSVSSATVANIRATYNGVTRTVPVTIMPAAALSGLTLNPASVSGGSATTGTVTLTDAAPAGGALVSLISDNPAAVPPASVVVNAGESSATFSLPSLAVGTATSGLILAVYNGVNVSSSLTVTPGAALALSSVVLQPTSVIGGNVSQGTVTLNGLAPDQGIQVNLSSNSGVAHPDTSVFVNGGSSTATFNVTTTSVSTSTAATITASYNGGTKTAVLTVAPVFGLSGVSVNPTSVAGGTTSLGTVTLSGAAPAGGTTVSLSSNQSAASVPSSVTVAAGNFTGTFTVTTTAVASVVNATISAVLSGVTKTAALTVLPSSALQGISLNPATVVGGNSSTGTVTLTGAAPAGGTAVALSSSSPSATLPANVTVSAGATTATFTVATTPVSTATVATISAVAGGVTKTSLLTITLPAALSGVTLNPSSVTGGSSSTGTVTLTSAAPAGGALIALSDNSASASVPASVTVSEGATTATFAVTTTAVTANVSATISAVYSGVTQTALLTITSGPVALSSVTLDPTSVAGGSPSTGTITLTGGAPAGGATVTLSSNKSSAVVPASVTVAPGSSTATFTVSTTSVITATSATIKAVYSGVTKSATLAITPPAALSSVALSPASVAGGSPSTGTVTLNRAAPAGGATVTLSSNNAAAIVPANVVVAAGSTTATFTVTTTAVTASTSATIGATYAGVTKTKNLTITPPAGVALSALSVNTTYPISGIGATGTVTLSSAAPAGGIAVALSSNNVALTVPASVTVAAGSTTATFAITVNPVSAASTSVSISAVYSGVTKTVSVTVVPLFGEIDLNPVSAKGGTTSTGTVLLSAPAPAGGIVIALSSNNAAATVPASVTVPAGGTSATFTVSTTTVTSTTFALISGTYATHTELAGFSVTP